MYRRIAVSKITTSHQQCRDDHRRPAMTLSAMKVNASGSLIHSRRDLLEALFGRDTMIERGSGDVVTTLKHRMAFGKLRRQIDDERSMRRQILAQRPATQPPARRNFVTALLAFDPSHCVPKQCRKNEVWQ